MRAFIFLFSIFIIVASSAQILQKPSAYDIAHSPLWAQEMYSDNPNVPKVDSLYFAYYTQNLYVKNYHTQYYKRWKRAIGRYINDAGYIEMPSAEQENALNADMKNKRLALKYSKSGNWSATGPFTVYNNQNNTTGEQTNVYCMAQCAAAPAVLYCGTEPGEIFKSADGGNSWICVSENVAITSGVGAIAVANGNPDTVLAGSGNALYRSTDGGQTWTTVISASGLNVMEILIHPVHSHIILVASSNGLLKSTDGGTTFQTVISKPCYDVKSRPGNHAVVYALCGNIATEMAEFYLSTDTASVFTLQTSGWYSSSDPNRNDGGGRIAVSPANPLRVYAYLIGEAKADDYGFIGVFRSDDGGVSWTLPNGPAGGPYTSGHPNLAYGTTDWTYHQGYYNCAIIADKNDADKILVGGLNCWRSNDGGATFSSVAGYVGGPLNMHVDMQDFRETATDSWITTDGGIYHSTDFFQSQPAVQNNGIRGSEYWGYGQGWNEDFSVGGLYHNGVISHFENYGAGNALQLGGAEPASGYANPGPGRKVMSSEVGGRMLPAQIGDAIGSFNVSMFPNESYWAAESGEMEWAPDCYNTVFLGKDNKLFCSYDNGISFSQVNAFGTNTASRVQHIEISRSNPMVMYVSQRPASGSTGKIFKTTDGGTTWTQLTIPAGNSSRILLSLSPVNENLLWVAYPSGANGSKVFNTVNGGTTWNNMTTAELNNEEIRSMIYVPNSNESVYLFSYHNVFYRNDSMSMWAVDAAGLPDVVNTQSAKPFYRDGKIRLATYGKGIWEKSFNIQPAKPVAQIMVDKLSSKPFCSADSFYFDDYSILNHNGASWSWTFENGNPATSMMRNPVVVFPGPGQYEVTLMVTDSSGISDSDTLTVTVEAYVAETAIQEGFENGFLPYNWMTNAGSTGGNWTLTSRAGAYGNSAHSAMFDNFNFDSQGDWSDIYAGWNLSSLTQDYLTFDVAYSRYGGQYSDTLEVRVSTDCGLTWNLLYRKGGDSLATAPSITDSVFVPEVSQWRTDSIDISAFSGESNVIVAFRNIGHWGQGMYIDNIMLNGSTGIGLHPSTNPVSLYPNPVGAGSQLYISGETGTTYTFSIFNAEGKQIMLTQVAAGQSVSTAGLAPGNYFYRVFSDQCMQNGTLMVVPQR